MKLKNKLFTEVFNKSDVFLLTCTSSYTSNYLLKYSTNLTYFYLLVHHLTHILLITLLQKLRWKRSSVNQKSPIKHCAKFFLSWKHSCCYIQEYTCMGYIPGFVITRRYLQYSWKSLTKLRRGCLYKLSPESISPARKLGLALLRICLKFHNHVKRHHSICTINVPETPDYRN